MSEIIFVGNPVPVATASESGVHDVNIADNIAQNTVIKGLYERYGKGLTVVSVSADKSAAYVDLGDGLKARAIPSNGRNVITYYLSVMVNYAKELFKVLRTMDGREVIVITNGPYIYRAMAVILAKRKYKNVKWVPFLIGAVEVPEAKFPFSLISKMSRWTVKKADGAITYVGQSVEDYMPDKPYVEIVYLIDEGLMNVYAKDSAEKNEKFTIAYTGALTTIYNLDVILEVIRMTGSTYRWVFAGVGPFAAELEALSIDDRYDVEYLGRVSNLEAIQVQKTSHLLICLKGGDHTPINQYYSKYAASGKLTEYLCSGTPILAGDIPAFSKSIRPFATFEKRQSAEQIATDIAEIASNYDAKMSQARRGQAYAFEHFNARYQNDRVYDFLGEF